MGLTIRKLLKNHSLDLRVVTSGSPGAEEDAERALDREFEWIHATDMIDPIQFLGPAEVILTLGWQFPVLESANPRIPEIDLPRIGVQRSYDEYVSLVAAHGVIGIGFGSDVVHRGVPRFLVEACQKYDVVLFDVPYEVSFMDILQESARVVQRDHSERYTRSLRAQKAIATAATRRDGLVATLHETARQLGCGVSLFDAVGQPLIVVPSPGKQAADEPELGDIVVETLGAHRRFTSVQVTSDVEAVVQLLGETDDPSGVLVLTLSQGFDDVSRNVLTSVLALVSVSLEQNQALREMHHTLREVLLHLLVSGSVDAVKHISSRVWGALPGTPLAALVCIPRTFDSTRFIAALESVHLERELSFFFAPHGSDIAVFLSEDDTEKFLKRTAEFELFVGKSEAGNWSAAGRMLEEASRAARFGMRQGNDGLTEFATLGRRGISDLIDAEDAEHVAIRMLHPLLGMGERTGTDYLETLRAWLEVDCRPFAAAQTLGIHRQTLTRRLSVISQVTGLDLGNYQERAELILALRYFSSPK